MSGAVARRMPGAADERMAEESGFGAPVLYAVPGQESSGLAGCTTPNADFNRSTPARLARALEQHGLLDRSNEHWQWIGDSSWRGAVRRLLYGPRAADDLLFPRRRECGQCRCCNPRHFVSRKDLEREKRTPNSRWRRQQRAKRRVQWHRRVRKHRQHLNALRRQSRARNREGQRLVWLAWKKRQRHKRRRRNALCRERRQAARAAVAATAPSTHHLPQDPQDERRPTT